MATSSSGDSGTLQYSSLAVSIPHPVVMDHSGEKSASIKTFLHRDNGQKKLSSVPDASTPIPTGLESMRDSIVRIVDTVESKQQEMASLTREFDDMQHSMQSGLRGLDVSLLVGKQKQIGKLLVDILKQQVRLKPKLRELRNRVQSKKGPGVYVQCLWDEFGILDKYPDFAVPVKYLEQGFNPLASFNKKDLAKVDLITSSQTGVKRPAHQGSQARKRNRSSRMAHGYNNMHSAHSWQGTQYNTQQNTPYGQQFGSGHGPQHQQHNPLHAHQFGTPHGPQHGSQHNPPYDQPDRSMIPWQTHPINPSHNGQFSPHLPSPSQNDFRPDVPTGGEAKSEPIEAANERLFITREDLRQFAETLLNSKKGGSGHPIALDSDDEVVKHSEDED
ncbi:hypothetical protein PG993_008998 [Apiospora rasikravindrae]|uniref:Uncharacterized protein n=1 Tax=Apiospora rasikravindrae TaxID=990691 RepID=A0ABR1SI41_9PEZI